MNAKKDLDFKKKWIQWVLDFIQTDLSSMTMSQRKQVGLEAYLITSNLFDELTFDQLEAAYEERPWDIEKELNIFNLQTGLKIFLETIENMVLSKKRELIELPKTASFLGVFEYPDKFQLNGYPEDVKWIGEFNITSKFNVDNPLNTAIVHFSKLIEGLEIHSIMKCKGCGRYFLNPTRKEKIYCNSACASRSIARKRYEELKKNSKKYEAHLKKYRKYSKQRYERLRKTQFGPNVRIQKRNRRREG